MTDAEITSYPEWQEHDGSRYGAGHWTVYKGIVWQWSERRLYYRVYVEPHTHWLFHDVGGWEWRFWGSKMFPDLTAIYDECKCKEKLEACRRAETQRMMDEV